MVASMHKHNRFNAKQLMAAVIAVVLFLVLSPGAWAAVQLDVDRTRVTEGETVTLTFLTDDAKKNLETDFSRIQFTPDLLPSDITGSEVLYTESGDPSFRFEQGPGYVILAPGAPGTGRGGSGAWFEVEDVDLQPVGSGKNDVCDPVAG